MNDNLIDQFIDEYFFLSNFYECPVIYDGLKYNSSEAAYQAQKVINPDDKVVFCKLTPEQSKKFSRVIEIRDDWDNIKEEIMQNIVYNKFKQNTELHKKLIETYPKHLYEGNTWDDRYWGININDPEPYSSGKNMLGNILMRVRRQLIDEDKVND